MSSASPYERTLDKHMCPQCGVEYVGRETPCPHDGSDEPEHDAELLIGTILADHYEIIQLVGEGGMSVVYKARHNLMNRVVAIKMLHKHLVSHSTTIKRFQQEAIAVSHLSHPNIIAVHDFGITPEVQPYLIMDYLEGVSLGDLLEKQGALHVKRAATIFTQICDALGHAHSKGVVHRDLKPSNVMLVEVDANPDFVKLVDFGIAKLTIGAQQEGQHLTRTGEIFGSPLYMSPEQCMGQALDARSDIYSMGCVMYETLIGRPPFSGTNVLETMYMRLTENAPSFGSVRSDIKIPPQLESVVFKAMAPEPKQRYQTMAELKEALLRAVSQISTHTGVRAFVPQVSAKVQQFVLKRKRLTPEMVIGLAALLLLAGGTLAWKELTGVYSKAKDPANFEQQLAWQQYQREAQRFADEQDFGKAEKMFLAAAKEAEAFGEKDPRLIKTLEQLEQVYQADGKLDEAAKIEERIETIRAHNPVHELGDAKTNLDLVIDSALALVPKTLTKEDWAKYHGLTEDLTRWAVMCIEQKNYKRAEQLYKKELDIERQTLGNKSPDVARTLSGLASLYHRSEGRYEAAEPLYREALKIREEEFGKNHPDVAASLGDLGLLYKDQGKFADSEKLYKRALAIYEKHVGANQPETASTLAGLAEVYRVQGRYEESEPLYRKVLKIDEESPGANERSLAMSLNNLAGVYENRGKYSDAEPLYRRALSTYEKILGPDDAIVATVINNLAVDLYVQGKYNEAEPLFKRALAIRSRILSPDHPELAQSLNSLAEVHRAQGKYDDVESLLTQALEINEKAFGTEHPEVASVLNGFGQLYEARGKNAEAEEFFKGALAIREKTLGPDHPATAKSINDLGNLYLKEGKVEEAGHLLRQSMDIREKTLGPSHPDTLATWNTYGDYLMRSNHVGEGLKLKYMAMSANLSRLWPFK